MTLSDFFVHNQLEDTQEIQLAYASAYDFSKDFYYNFSVGGEFGEVRKHLIDDVFSLYDCSFVGYTFSEIEWDSTRIFRFIIDDRKKGS